jgi:hypothetical protein
VVDGWGYIMTRQSSARSSEWLAINATMPTVGRETIEERVKCVPAKLMAMTPLSADCAPIAVAAIEVFLSTRACIVPALS